MKTLYLMAATFLGIAACVTSGPELPKSLESPELAKSAANARSSVTNSSSTEVVGQLEVAKVPEVPITAYMPTEDAVICRKERRIGSNIPRRVCRTRAEIEATSAASQEILRNMSTQIDDSRLQR